MRKLESDVTKDADVLAKGRSGSVQSIERAFGLLEAIARHGGMMGLSQLAAESGLPPATIHRLVRTLVDLGYLTTGLSWKADYVALFDEPNAKLDLQGWVTLTNGSGTPFVDADTKLVAGQVQVAGSGASGYYNPTEGVTSAGTETNTGPGKALGDFYIYSLPERTTIQPSQTKQVSFLDAQGVTAHRVYQWNAYELISASEPAHAVVGVDFNNSTGGGLGSGLPAGTVRIYQRDASGSPKFVGESPIGHVPQGSELLLKMGEAFDVTVQPTLVADTSVSTTRSRYSMSYVLRNAKSEAVTVELRQSGYWGRDTKVISESLASRKIERV